MRKLVALAVGLVALVATAAPAWSHEEINPKTFPTGQPSFFLLSAANEKKTNLTKVVLTAPKEVPFGGTTKEPSGWTVSATDTAITWTATSGGVKPDAFEQWGFETDGADQPGTFTFKAALSYADGTTDNVDVPVTAVFGTGAGASAAKPSQTRATAALVVGIVALVLAIVALALSARRRAGATAGGPPPAPDF